LGPVKDTSPRRCGPCTALWSVDLDGMDGTNLGASFRRGPAAGGLFPWPRRQGGGRPGRRSYARV